MKPSVFTSLFTLCIFFSLISTAADRLTFHPKYPQPGQEIAITYNPSGTALEDANDIILLAYCYPAGMPIVLEVDMKKTSGIWRGNFSSSDTTLAVYIILRSGDKLDDNNKNGYVISQYTSEGNLVKGGMVRQAQVASAGGTYPLRLHRDWDKAIDFFEKEFELYPEQQQNLIIVNSYWYHLHYQYKDSAEHIIKTRLEKLGQKENKTTQELNILVNWYQRVKENELARKYEKQLLEREPKGSHVEFKQFMECVQESSIDNKQRLLLAFINDFPNSEYTDQLNSSMISAFTRKNLFSEAEQYVNDYVNDPNSKYFNTIALPMIKKEIRLEKALELAGMAVEKARLEIDAKEKPGHYTQLEWQNQQNRLLSDVLDTYGLGLYKIGEIEQSINVYEEAVRLSQRKSRGIRIRYCRALYKVGDIEQTYTELESLVMENPLKQNIYPFLKEVYFKYNGSENGFESLIAIAKKEHRLKLRKAIKEQMIEVTAPKFTLRDLNGNIVSLSDYKGKIILLDFWATWCGPCVGSFPGMQKLQDRYKDDESIKFLFIDTMEKGDNVIQKVQEFIAKKNYTFHVLLDMEETATSRYKVLGIPTKFVIDPMGNIRFRIKGSKDNEIELIEELDIMINLMRETESI